MLLSLLLLEGGARRQARPARSPDSTANRASGFPTVALSVATRATAAPVGQSLDVDTATPPTQTASPWFRQPALARTK